MTLIGRVSPKTGPIGLALTDSGHAIASLPFSFFPDGEIFKLTWVLDSSCRPVGYWIEVRPGEKRVLQNWDTILFPEISKAHAVRLSYTEDEIAVNFRSYVQ